MTRPILTIGLLGSLGTEISYPGYAQCKATFESSNHAPASVANDHAITFPTYKEPTSLVVAGMAIYNPDGLLARVAFDVCVVLSDGVTPVFAIGAIVITPNDLSPGVIDKFMRDVGAYGPRSKAMPTHCKKCNHYNEYVGAEHLNAAGDYVCRSCR